MATFKSRSNLTFLSFEKNRTKPAINILIARWWILCLVSSSDSGARKQVFSFSVPRQLFVQQTVLLKSRGVDKNETDERDVALCDWAGWLQDGFAAWLLF